MVKMELAQEISDMRIRFLISGCVVISLGLILLTRSDRHNEAGVTITKRESLPTSAPLIAERIPNLQGLKQAIITAPKSPDVLFEFLARLKSPLNDDDVATMCKFLAVPNIEGVSDTYLASAKNELINRLGNEVVGADRVQKCLLQIQSDINFPPVMRDYALQHLAARFDTYPNKAATVTALLNGIDEDQETIAATAMLAFQRLRNSGKIDAQMADHVDQAAIRYLNNNASSEPAKMAALQLIRSNKEAVSCAKRLLHTETRFPIRVAAVGIIGASGQLSDLEDLQLVKKSADHILLPALSHAISAIQSRN